MVLLIVFGVVAVFVLGGILYQQAGIRHDAKCYPAPGRMIDIGNHVRLHAHISGRGSPVVVLEAGIAATSLSWRPVQSRVAEFATVCSYDRAGLGWSDPGSTPRTPSVIATELHTLLDAAGLAEPYVLVGHSFGGLVVQQFAAKYPGSVRGLVLVDPLAASEWYPMTPNRRRILNRGIALSRRGATLAQVGVVRACITFLLSGRHFAPRLAGRVASGAGGAGFLNRIAREIGKLPDDLWPLIASHWCNPRAFQGMVSHLADLPRSAEESAGLHLEEVPATVIAGAKNSQPETDLAPALPHAKRIRAHESGHWVQLDEPELVVDAIRELIERSGGAV